MTAGVNNKLPYGNLPRLLLAWVCTEAVRTQNSELILGRSLADFMRSVGVYDDGGAVRRRLRNQMQRLFRSHVELVYEDAHGSRFVNSAIAAGGEFWWDVKRPDQPALWESKIELGEKFFHEVITNPIPLDLHILKAVKRSPLGLDLYLWLTYRTFAAAAHLSTGLVVSSRPAHQLLLLPSPITVSDAEKPLALAVDSSNKRYWGFSPASRSIP